MAFTGELVAATAVQPADDAPLVSLHVTHDDGATLLAVERAGGARDVFHLGAHWDMQVAPAGHRTEPAAPTGSAPQKEPH
jgi:hypothetical protein